MLQHVVLLSEIGTLPETTPKEKVKYTVSELMLNQPRRCKPTSDTPGHPSYETWLHLICKTTGYVHPNGTVDLATLEKEGCPGLERRGKGVYKINKPQYELIWNWFKTVVANEPVDASMRRTSINDFPNDDYAEKRRGYRRNVNDVMSVIEAKHPEYEFFKKTYRQGT